MVRREFAREILVVNEIRARPTGKHDKGCAVTRFLNCNQRAGRDERCCLRGGSRALHSGEEVSNGGMIEEDGRLQFQLELLLDRRQEIDRGKGIAAQFEIVVVQTDGGGAKGCAPTVPSSPFPSQ